MPRAKTKSFILELKLKTNNNDLVILNKRFKIAEGIYNKTLKYSLKQIKRMKENKDYKRALSDYLNYKKLDDKDNIKSCTDTLNSIRKKYSLTEYGLFYFVKMQRKLYEKHFDSNTCQKIASVVWRAISDILFGNGNRASFKKYGQLTSLEGKTNKSGIRFSNNILSWKNLNIPVKIRKNDIFAKECLENHRIKYCRIVRRAFKNGFKYFLQLIFEGVPPTKRNKDGSFRHTAFKKNRIGIDIGTSTIAVCSKNKLMLSELAPESSKYDKEIHFICRKLERSRRNMNPLNYNSDGTIKCDCKLKWINSKSYIKNLFKLKNLYRLKANYIKLSHNDLANKILSIGNEIYVENMDFKELQKRYHKGIRGFGKSLGNKSPSMLLEIIDRKLSYINASLNKVNTITFKASQYNHVEDKYIKKDISDRWNDISGDQIQRDLYSAFLLMNSKKDLKKTNRSLCVKTYKEFKKSHDKLITELKLSENKLPCSFGI